MKRTEWFKRSFPVIEDNGTLPSIIERLSGTPVRLETMVQGLSSSLLTQKSDGKWSIQEESGHLADMEPLWYGRLEDLLNGAVELRVADLTNQTTHNANHNAADLQTILHHFREQRKKFVAKLSVLTEDQLNNSALHPRLKTPMRIVDLAYFVAEHDDHHLAGIRENMNK
ncbi:MAG: DinB family protein [Chitinophagaceae bacterium]